MATTFLYLLLLSCFVLDTTFGVNLCGDQLLPGIPDSHITATSSLAPAGGKAYTGPERGRLNTQQIIGNGTVLMGGWAPAADNKGQYIQAMFDDLTYVESILTQGQNPAGGFVKLYKLEYTEDGVNWKPVNLVSTFGVEQIFKGNDDSDTPVEGELDCPVFAKGIRIIPIEWESHIALRFDVKGCYVDNTVVATMPPPISTSTTTTPKTPLTTPTTTPLTTTATPSTASTRMTTNTTTVATTPVTTPLTTAPPFLPGILTPFGLSTTTPVTTLNPTTTAATGPPTTTVNLLTLIHWFLTALSNTSSTTSVPTTPLTTSTKATTLPTTTASTTPSTPLTTTRKTTTTFPPFLPGILDPFGTTKRR